MMISTTEKYFSKQSVDSEVVLSVNGVSKKFCRDLKRSLFYGVQDIASELVGVRDATDKLRPQEFWALKDVSFELRRGEALGLVGKNGSGKSTLLRIIAGLIKPDAGSVEVKGRVAPLIALGAGFNPVLTGRENIYANMSILGLSKKEIDERFDQVVAFAEIGDAIDAPVRSYSSGMAARLGFSCAIHTEPDILLIDEVLSVGDAKFRSKCYKRIGLIITKCAVVFVSHDTYSVRRICDEILWLQKGKAIYHGCVELGMQKYIEDSISNEPGKCFVNSADDLSNIQLDAIDFHQCDANGNEIVDIEVTLNFKSNQHIELGLCLGNIMSSDEVVVGQFDFKQWISVISSGDNLVKFRISEVRLAQGNYTAALIVFDKSNKELLLNIRHFIYFTVKGNIRYGPHYAISTTLLNGQSLHESRSR